MISRPNGFLVVLNMIKELQIGQGKPLKRIIVMFGKFQNVFFIHFVFIINGVEKFSIITI